MDLCGKGIGECWCCDKVGEEEMKRKKRKEEDDDGGLWKLLLSLLVKIPGLEFTVGI